MSILIKGIDMPKNCYDCPFESHNRCYFSVMGLPNVVEAIDRPKACPLVEIPTPHGRLIDANKLEAMMYHEAFETDSDMQKWDSGCWIRYKVFENCMNRLLPDTIIEAEE